MKKRSPLFQQVVRDLTDLENNLEKLPSSDENDVFESMPASSIDDSETRSFSSDFTSNTDLDSLITMDSGLENLDEAKDTEQKVRLSKLKNSLKDQLKEFSLDNMLLAGAQAASQLSFSNAFAFSGAAGGNVKVGTIYICTICGGSTMD